MKYLFLTREFYDKYNDKDYPEIEIKLTRLDIDRNKEMCKYSTLQYWHKELGIS